MVKETQAEKRPTRRVPSDDCVVEGRHPHRGEWVEIAGAASVKDLRASWNATSLGVQIESLRDDEALARRQIERLRENGTGGSHEADLILASKRLEAAIEERMALVDGSFAELAKAVARRVVAWNWTDDTGRPIVPWNAQDTDGRPYTILDGSPDLIELVEVDELTYLRGLLTGEAPAEKGEGDGGLPPTDSAIPSNQTDQKPARATARNRMRA